jgi:hypothetical protein
MFTMMMNCITRVLFIRQSKENHKTIYKITYNTIKKEVNSDLKVQKYCNNYQVWLHQQIKYDNWGSHSGQDVNVGLTSCNVLWTSRHTSTFCSNILPISSALKMEAICFYKSIQCYNPEDQEMRSLTLYALQTNIFKVSFIYISLPNNITLL